jgi:hypothetical protein
MSAGKAISSAMEYDTKGRMNFTDQTVNRDIARESSKTREKVTADLKEASDRIWLAVVRHVSRDCPALRYAITLRSTHVRLPSGRVLRLNKLANMGSGICFPFLALMVYTTSVVALIEDERYGLNEAMEAVNVYGDDLEVPRTVWPTVKRWLLAIGLLVNDDKTYVDGYFRESCGGDYYHGVEVAPTRFRLSGEGLDPVKQYRNGSFPIVTAEGFNQLDRHCRELVLSGLTATAAYYYKQLEARLGTLPYVSYESPCLGKFDLSKIVRGSAQKAYFPTVVKTRMDGACPYKGLGQSFLSKEGLLQDWSLTPLRRQISLKRRVPSLVELVCFGRTEDPEDLFPWKRRR